MNSNKSYRLAILLGVLLALVLIGWQGYQAYSRRGKVAVQLSASPSDAKVTMDGKKVRVGKLYVLPGSHEFRATRAEFSDKTVSINVAQNTGVVILLMSPSTDAGRRFLSEHPKEQSLRESLGGIIADKQGQQTIDNTPIIKLLPFIDREFRVDYGPSVKHPEDKTAVAIIITYTTDASKQAALNWIQASGFDPKTLEIVYKKFTN